MGLRVTDSKLSSTRAENGRSTLPPLPEATEAATCPCPLPALGPIAQGLAHEPTPLPSSAFAALFEDTLASHKQPRTSPAKLHADPPPDQLRKKVGNARRDQTFAANPGSPTGDSRETTGALQQVGSGVRRQVRTLSAAVSGPTSARRRAVEAKTDSGQREARVPRSQGSKLAAPGPGLQALSGLNAARPCDFPPEPRVSGVLAQSHSDYFPHIATVSLTAQLLLNRESRCAHLRITFRAAAKANSFDTGLSRRKKKHLKQVTYQCCFGAQLETWSAVRNRSRVRGTSRETSGCLQRDARSAPLSGFARASAAPAQRPQVVSSGAQGAPRCPDSLARPRHQPRDLRLSPAGRKERPAIQQAFGHRGSGALGRFGELSPPHSDPRSRAG
ncbi:uncharacterized protein LOC123622267 [Lemur catta]|uniref:uncharacterized protein LOC123622267 n=1 Tax=Lemur catta TaxID=9447 RepID=UPI001E26C939|nr:uncharacterized protein LOC123622267 [Lemur catta]